MTLESALVWSSSRALIVTSLALPLALLIGKAVQRRQTTRTWRSLLVVAALLPLFVPDLLIGFTYRLASARLIHSIVATEALYAVLLMFRVIALQIVVQLILPQSAVSAESLHLWKLRRNQSDEFNWSWWLTWIRLQISGPSRAPLVAWLSGALLCFQEFETAALLQVDRHPIAWTVWLFDAHLAGEPLVRSLSLAVPAVLLQCLLLIPGLWLLISGSSSDDSSSAHTARRIPSTNGTGSAALWLVATSIAFVIAWPVISNGPELIGGMKSLFGQGDLWQRLKPILASLTECGLAAFIALQICSLLSRLRKRALKLALILPGLCGSLILSLTLLALFQSPVLHVAYDTWLPMLTGHTLLMLPRAFLLVTILRFLTDSSSQHSGNLLSAARHTKAVRSASELSWMMHKRKWLLALAVLTHWCFWDVTIAATLRPVGFEPIISRLYNEMHYGRTESLVAITALSLVIPLAAFVLIGWVWKSQPIKTGL